MAIADAFGVWENLGNVSPVFDWQFTPLSPTAPTSTLRIIYYSQAIAGFNLNHPLGWLRASYFSGSSYWFDHNWIKLYPKDEPEIIHYPYPPDLIKEPLPQRQFQIKFSDSRYARRLAIDRKWSCEIFAKVSTNVFYPVSSFVPEQSRTG